MSEAEKERQRIVDFLYSVYDASTHGASGLFERAILAVEAGELDDPVSVARPPYEEDVEKRTQAKDAKSQERLQRLTLKARHAT